VFERLKIVRAVDRVTIGTGYDEKFTL